MRRASPWFAGSAVCAGLVIGALTLTAQDVSEEMRSVATLAVAGVSVLAVLLSLSGFYIWWQMSNARLSIRVADTATVGAAGDATMYTFPLLRLRLENMGMPGQFHAEARWVDDGGTKRCVGRVLARHR